MEFMGYIYISIWILLQGRGLATFESNTLQPYGVRMCEMMCGHMMCERCVFIVSEQECKVITVNKPASYAVSYRKTLPHQRAQDCSVLAERTSCGDPTEMNLSTVYACQLDHRPCGYHYSVAICKGSDDWGFVSNFVCKQHKWYRSKPTIRFRGDIPWCDVRGSRTLRITIKGRPRSRTIFEVYLLGRSVVFYLRCKFIDPFLTVNDKLAGRWGREVRFPGFPFKEHQMFLMQITYTGGTYQVDVDRKRLVTFKERSNKAPDRLAVHKDIYVQSVEMIHV